MHDENSRTAIQKLKSFEKYKNISDEEATQIIDTIELFGEIVYEIITKELNRSNHE